MSNNQKIHTLHIPLNYLLGKLDNLFEVKFIKVPWDKFRIVDGGTVIARNFVESTNGIYFAEHGIDPTKIVSINACAGYGYSEYAVITPNKLAFMCGQILASSYCKSPEGDMSVMVLTLNSK